MHSERPDKAESNGARFSWRDWQPIGWVSWKLMLAEAPGGKKGGTEIQTTDFTDNTDNQTVENLFICVISVIRGCLDVRNSNHKVHRARLLTAADEDTSGELGVVRVEGVEDGNLGSAAGDVPDHHLRAATRAGAHDKVFGAVTRQIGNDGYAHTAVETG